MSSDPTLPALLTMMQALLDGQVRIDRRLAWLEERGRARVSLSEADRRRLEVIVSAVAVRRIPRTVFYAREVIEWLVPLPDALEKVFGTRTVTSGTTKSLGKLLARAAACRAEIDGYVVERDEKAGEVFWKLCRV
jgi:hypothetical protein